MASNGIPQLEYTPIEDLEAIADGLKKTFLSNKMRDVKFRLDQIKQVGFLVQDHEKEICAALKHDLRRHESESYIVEINVVLADCIDVVKHLNKWAKPESVKTDLTWFLSRPKIYKEPKGTVLVVAPFNYPVSLCLTPLIGALAGGNTVLVKPSEQTQATSALLAKLIPLYLDPKVVQVVNGGKDCMVKLLEIPFDHIFFTGSGNVGKIVAQAAAKHHCPVTLELGGKSPAVVLADADIKIAARRIAWGKQVNAAQTCIAPDHVLIAKSLQPKFIEAYKSALKEFYPRGEASIDSDQFCSLITPAAYGRLSKALTASKGETVIGGSMDEEAHRIDNTVVANVKNDDPLMEQELFGPILPLVNCESPEEAVRLIRGRDHPLALYVFCRDSKKKDYIFERTRSGAFVWNDNLVHFTVPGLPFGGHGPSGYGNYHGKRTFDTFVHERAYMSVPYWMEAALGIRYPPYTEGRHKMFKLMLGKKLTFSRPNQVGFLQKLIARLGVLRTLVAVVAALGILQRLRQH